MISPRQFFTIAQTISHSSTCSRLRVGAILVVDRRIVSSGYNGAPSGVTHCYHQEGDDRPCMKAVHAEVNCVAFAARHGVVTLGSTLYSTHAPCLPCSMLLINAGVAEVQFLERYRVADGLDLLKTAGVTVTKDF